MMFLSLLKPQILIHFYSKSCMILMTLSIYQYKIQYILPNTFANKESIAQEDSLHNQLKNFISYPLIVWGGGGAGHWNDPSHVFEHCGHVHGQNPPWCSQVAMCGSHHRGDRESSGGSRSLRCWLGMWAVSSEEKGGPGGVGHFLGKILYVCVFIYIYIDMIINILHIYI